VTGNCRWALVIFSRRAIVLLGSTSSMAFQFSEIIKNGKIMFPPHMTRKVEHHNRNFT
jgi:hypothetical protein